MEFKMDVNNDGYIMDEDENKLKFEVLADDKLFKLTLCANNLEPIVDILYLKESMNGYMSRPMASCKSFMCLANFFNKVNKYSKIKEIIKIQAIVRHEKYESFDDDNISDETIDELNKNHRRPSASYIEKRFKSYYRNQPKKIYDEIIDAKTIELLNDLISLENIDADDDKILIYTDSEITGRVPNHEEFGFVMIPEDYMCNSILHYNIYLNYAAYNMLCIYDELDN